jgi:glycosyltransferase involved in cell wall biosynthesis
MLLRVALVAPFPPPCGGISTWTHGLLQLVSQDREVEIIHIDSAVRFRSPAFLSLGARVTGGLVHGLALLVRFARTLLAGNVDVAHICMSGSLGACRDILLVIFARLMRIPIVTHLRFGRLPALVASPNWETALIGRICKLSQHVIVLEQASAEAVRVLAPNCSVLVIPNPAWKINEIIVAPIINAGAKTVVFAGHVIPAKGVRELVLACRDIQGIEFRLDLIGPVEEDFREELKALSIAKDNGEWLNFSGPVDGSIVLAHIAGCTVVVLPSYTEGFPNVVLEAMMLGKPVIATPVGAIPQMLSFDGIDPCGICVPVGDADALKIAIESLLNQTSYAQEFGRRGRERVTREYSPNTVYSQYKLIWEKAAGF